MSNKDHQSEGAARSDLSRRDLVALSVAAGLAAATGVAASADLPVVETNVEVKTPDGKCDAAFIHPKNGSYPGVLIWPDAFGLRPALRQMGKRLAAEGYSVLIPNPYYRAAKVSALNLNTATFSFQNADDMARLRKLMEGLNAPGAAEKDAVAFIAYLDKQKSVDTAKKIGTQGYCMGGPLVFKTAAAEPDRIGAAASFHGGGLVTDQPNSPHLLVPKMKARFYIGIASNDDMRQPDAKDKLREAFDAAKLHAEIEVYQSLHGWCMPDMPASPDRPIYNKADAERAWGKLLELYKTALA
ncbi:MAG TPA: dienelactone hydrolase family protein [Chthonomonadaceae bacterium]|nr:dienelactone hydrolase family protein [Chthonomonadaceae bacterium]